MRRSLEEELFLDEIRDLAAGKLTSTMLDVVFELDVFGKLHGKSMTIDEFAEMLGMPVSPARLVGQFLCKKELLLFRDGRLSNSPAAEKFLSSENLVRREIVDIKRYTAVSAEALKQRLFEPSDRHWYQLLGNQGHFGKNNLRRIFWGEELAERYDFKPHKLLLDVAGAAAGWCIGIRKTNPHLRCIVFDLPEGAEFAEKAITEAGQSDDVRYVSGSFLTDDLPPGADVALIANILHHWSVEDDRMILGKIYEALAPNGTILIREFFFEDDWTGTSEAVFQAYISGRVSWQPTYSEMEELLRQVGFVDLERRHDLIIGKKRSLA